MENTNHYFTKLNYSLANEDTSLERKLSQIYRPQNIISVCGSGSRALPLITPDTKILTIVDLAEQQLMMAKLRIQTYIQLSYEQFLTFWDYPNESNISLPQDRKKLFQSLKLDSNCKTYFTTLFESYNWQSILYAGKWEKTFILFSKIIEKILGKKHTQKVFSFDQLHDQQSYIQNEFPQWRWKLLIALIGNKALFNALLYKGSFIKKNISSSYFDHYYLAFNRLFQKNLAKKSFFLQLCFLGKILYKEGILVEANLECFQQIKECLPQIQINFLQTDIINAIQSQKNIHFVSLSDVPSYFSEKVEKSFLLDIRPSLSHDAVIVLRNYLRIPDANRNGLLNINHLHQELLNDECVQMYNIEVLKYEQ